MVMMAGLPVFPVSLDISPNLQQFFTGGSLVYLSCVEDGQKAEGWTVKRTRGGPAEDCGPAGSSSVPYCLLDLSGPSAGDFWCEMSSGERSDNVSITVLDKGLILEIPALPVRAGCDVTLRCRRSNGDFVGAFFFMGGRRLGSGPELVLSEVQLADEGSYLCSTDRFGKSPYSFLRVTAPLHHNISPPPPPVSAKTDPGGSPPSAPPSFTPHPLAPSSPTPPPSPDSCISAVHLLCHLLVICPYCVCSVLLVLMCCSRNSGTRPAVSMETRQPACPDGVTTEHNF